MVSMLPPSPEQVFVDMPWRCWGALLRFQGRQASMSQTSVAKLELSTESLLGHIC